MAAGTAIKTSRRLPDKCPRCRGKMRKLGDRSECTECRFTVHQDIYPF